MNRFLFMYMNSCDVKISISNFGKLKVFSPFPWNSRYRSLPVPYFIEITYAETLSEKQLTGTTNRNRIWLEYVLQTWMQ